MAAFATPGELASWLQVDSVDTATATQALDVASWSIRNHCGWSINQETVTALKVDTRGGHSVFLRTAKLTAVATLVENGVTLVADTDYEWWGYGELHRLHGCWPCKPRALTVTYTHGYATAPEPLKGVCLQIAGRLFSNPENLRTHLETVGGVTESSTYAGNASELGVPLQTGEKEQLGPYMRYRFG